MEMTSMDMSSELEFELEMKNELEKLRRMKNEGKTFHWSASHYSKFAATGTPYDHRSGY